MTASTGMQKQPIRRVIKKLTNMKRVVILAVGVIAIVAGATVWLHAASRSPKTSKVVNESLIRIYWPTDDAGGSIFTVSPALAYPDGSVSFEVRLSNRSEVVLVTECPQIGSTSSCLDATSALAAKKWQVQTIAVHGGIGHSLVSIHSKVRMIQFPLRDVVIQLSTVDDLDIARLIEIADSIE